VSGGATHDNDAGDGVYKTTDTTRKTSPPLGTSSQRTQKSVQQDRTGGARRWYRDSSSGDENNVGERQQIPTTKTNTSNRTNKTKTTVRAGERSESGREIGGMGGEGGRTKGTTADLSDGLMGNNTSDKNKGGMQRTQKSVQQDQTRGARGLYRDSSSGDEKSEGERKQIPTTQTKTGGSETRTSNKGLHQKGGPRKLQSGGEREEDIKSRGGGRATAVGKKRTLEAHAPAGRPEILRKHKRRDVTLANGLNPGTNPVVVGVEEEGAGSGTRKRKGMCEHQRRRDRCKDCDCISEHQRRRDRCKDCGCSGLCEHQQRTLPLVLADAAAETVFTLAPHSLVLADHAAAAVFALAPLPLVLAEAAATAIFACAPPPLVFAEAAAATVFARAPLPLVLADAAAATVFTLAPTCRWCTQSPLPPQSLHLLLSRWCSQMLLPPQSLHLLLCRWCSQRSLPPQSLHWLLRRQCKDCRGSSLCEHQRLRSRCKDCGGSGICEHQRQRRQCKDCRKVKSQTAEQAKGKEG